MTWELRTGGAFGDADVVCGSARPSVPCTLAASTEQTRSSVSIELFVYPAAELTNYAGLIRLPFVQGWSRLNARDVSGSIPGGGRPVQTSVVGLVTTEPGEYTLRIALDAVYGAERKTSRLAVSVPVIVK